MKFLSAFLSASIILSWSLIQFSHWSLPALAAFSDVPDNHPYATAVEFVRSKGIVKGYEDGTYRPNNTINRAEFTKILIETIFDKATIDGCLADNPILFTDVKKTDWFAPYVCVAKLYLIITGYPDGSFKPGSNINHAESAKIFVISIDLPVTNISGDQAWYEAYTQTLTILNAIPKSVLSASHTLTRGEMADTIYKLKDHIDEIDSVSVITENNEDKSKSIANKAERDQVISLLNQERAKEELPPMIYNALLEKSAQAHSDDMRARGYFEHDTPDGVTAENRIERDGYLAAFHTCQCSKSYTVGENIAKGQSTASEVVETWMNSPQHRANIMNLDFNEIGIGLTPVDPNDTGFTGFFWVQNFGKIDLQ
jgi:uncharacterized protein YkwD